MKCFRRYHELGEYDRDKLKNARRDILSVYEYHYGDSYMRKEIKRLETIISKIDYLLQQFEKSGV